MIIKTDKSERIINLIDSVVELENIVVYLEREDCKELINYIHNIEYKYENENYSYKNRCREVVQMLDKILNHEPFGYDDIKQMKRILEEGECYE